MMILFAFISMIIFNQVYFINNLKLINRYGENEDNYILNAQDFVIDKTGNVFFTDKLSKSLCMIPEGSKEFIEYLPETKNKFVNSPSQITVSDHYIVISNFSSSKMYLFNSKLDFIKEIYVDGLIFDMSFNKRGNIICGVYSGKKDRVLLEYDISGKLIRNIKLANTKGDQFSDIFKFTVLDNGKIAIIYLIRNIIEIYDPVTGKSITEIIEKVPAKVNNKKLKQNLRVPTENLLQSICSFKNQIFILSGDRVTYPNQEIYEYDDSGNYLGTTILPTMSNEILVYDNFIFSIESSRKIVSRYKL